MHPVVPPTLKPPRWELDFPSPVAFALLMSAMFLGFFNRRFWVETARVFEQGQVQDHLFLLALMILLVLVHAAVLALIPGRRLMQVTAGVLFPVASMAAYCADVYGVVIDFEMIRNLGETDRREVMPLLGPRLLLYVAGLGMAPVLLVARSRIRPPGTRKDLLQRMLLVAAALTAFVFVPAGFGSHWRAFLHEHKSLHYLLVPGSAVQAAASFVHAGTKSAHVPASSDVPHRAAGMDGGKPLLVFFVIGETARHANFQLGGYPRPTNPALSGMDNLFYFTHVESCATSTAVAVPCMLSPLGREQFKKQAGGRPANALEMLKRAGFNVAWRSNNSGGKAINLHFDALRFEDRRTPPLCDIASCLDEILLEGLDQDLQARHADTVMVFHLMGSHGPAYRARYPRELEVFKPACDTIDLRSCSREELVNAYDNTLVYTDKLLAELIGILDSKKSRFDTALIYVSDHGESLGENGIFLHSAPYAYAPPEQKRVPLLWWMSDSYVHRFGIDRACLSRARDSAFSHDNIYHTLLGATGVRTRLYRSDMDVASGCRTGGGPKSSPSVASN